MHFFLYIVRTHGIRLSLWEALLQAIWNRIIILINKILLVFYSFSAFFFVERKLERKTEIHHGPLEMVAQFYAVPHFQVHKKLRSPPHLHQTTI